MHTCPQVTVLVPHVGGPILPPGCPTVLIGGMPAARVTDLATCVGPPDMIALGSPTVLIGGLLAARLGDVTAHGGVVVIGCPTVIIGEVGMGSPSPPTPGLAVPGALSSPSEGAASPAAPAAGGPADPEAMPTSIPKTCPDAPKTIKLPNDINQEFQDSFKNSFPGGKSQEQGGTLVQDRDGKIKLVNKGSGTSGTFTPDLNVGPGQTVIGTFHTHPYDESEGGFKGVSFSGADIANSVTRQKPSYVDAGDKQFMIMPTKATPAGDIRGDWQKELDAQLAAGKDLPEASRGAANTIAKKYKMAYYEGQNGELTRVSC
jgi:uncharacterized Zn-binding protein involved in type VI secretion